MPIIPFRTLGQLIGNTLYFNTEPDRNDRYWNTEGEVPTGTRFISDGENLSPEVANRPLMALATDINDLDWVIQREYAVQTQADITSIGTLGVTTPIVLGADRVFIQNGGGSTDPRDVFYIVDASTGQIAKNNDGTEVYVTAVESITGATDLTSPNSAAWEGADQATTLANFVADLDKPVAISATFSVSEFGRDYISVAPSAPFAAVEPGDLVVITDTAPKLGYESNDGLFTIREKVDDSTLRLIPFFRSHNPVIFSSSTNGPLPLLPADPSIELSELAPGVFGYVTVYYNTTFSRGINVRTNVDLDAGTYVIKYGKSARMPYDPDMLLSQGFFERTVPFGTQSYSGRTQDIIERIVWNPLESTRQWDDWDASLVQSLYTVNLDIRNITLQAGYDHNSLGAGNTYQKGSGREIVADAGPVDITVSPSWGYGAMSGITVRGGNQNTVCAELIGGSVIADYQTPLLIESRSGSVYTLATIDGTNIVEVDTVDDLSWMVSDANSGDAKRGPNPHIIRIPYGTSTEDPNAGLYFVSVLDNVSIPKQLSVIAMDGSTPTFSGVTTWVDYIYHSSVSSLWYVRGETYATLAVDMTDSTANNEGLLVITDENSEDPYPFVIAGKEYSQFGTHNLTRMADFNSKGHLSLGGVKEVYESPRDSLHTILSIGDRFQAIPVSPLTHIRCSLAETAGAGNRSGAAFEFPWTHTPGVDPLAPFDGLSLRTHWFSDSIGVDFHLTLTAQNDWVQASGTQFTTLLSPTTATWSLPTDSYGSDYYIELFSSDSSVSGLYRISTVASPTVLVLEDTRTGAPANFGISPVDCFGRIYARDFVLRAVTDYEDADLDYVHIKVPSPDGTYIARGAQIHVYDPTLDGTAIRIDGKDLRNLGSYSTGSLVHVSADYDSGGTADAVRLETGTSANLRSLLYVDANFNGGDGVVITGGSSTFMRSLLELTDVGSMDALLHISRATSTAIEIETDNTGTIINLVRGDGTSLYRVSKPTLGTSKLEVDIITAPELSQSSTTYGKIELADDYLYYGLNGAEAFSSFAPATGVATNAVPLYLNKVDGSERVLVEFEKDIEGTRRNASPVKFGNTTVTLTYTDLFPFSSGYRSHVERAVPIPLLGYSEFSSGTHDDPWIRDDENDSYRPRLGAMAGIPKNLLLPIETPPGALFTGYRLPAITTSGDHVANFYVRREFPMMNFVGYADIGAINDPNIAYSVGEDGGSYYAAKTETIGAALQLVEFQSELVAGYPSWVPQMADPTVSNVSSNRWKFTFDIGDLTGAVLIRDNVVAHNFTGNLSSLNIPFMGDYLYVISDENIAGLYPILVVGGSSTNVEITVFTTSTFVSGAHTALASVPAIVNPLSKLCLMVITEYNEVRIYPGMAHVQMYNDATPGGFPFRSHTFPR